MCAWVLGGWVMCVATLFSWPMLSLLPSLIVAHSDWFFHLRSQVQFSLFSLSSPSSQSLSLFLTTLPPFLCPSIYFNLFLCFFTYHLYRSFYMPVFCIVSLAVLSRLHVLLFVPTLSCHWRATLLIVLSPPPLHPPPPPHRWFSQHIRSHSADVL